DFSVQLIPLKYDLEILALASAVFAVAGSHDQRRWAYERLQPHAGRHVVVGGCAAYNGAVDHLLGRLAAALGETGSGAAHLRAALDQYDRLGATAHARIAEGELAALAAAAGVTNEFRFADGLWRVDFGGRAAQLADAKGLHDIAALLAAPGTEVHVF